MTAPANKGNPGNFTGGLVQWVYDQFNDPPKDLNDQGIEGPRTDTSFLKGGSLKNTLTSWGFPGTLRSLMGAASARAVIGSQAGGQAKPLAKITVYALEEKGGVNQFHLHLAPLQQVLESYFGSSLSQEEVSLMERGAIDQIYQGRGHRVSEMAILLTNRVTSLVEGFADLAGRVDSFGKLGQLQKLLRQLQSLNDILTTEGATDHANALRGVLGQAQGLNKILGSYYHHGPVHIAPNMTPPLLGVPHHLSAFPIPPVAQVAGILTVMGEAAVKVLADGTSSMRSEQVSLSVLEQEGDSAQLHLDLTPLQRILESDLGSQLTEEEIKRLRQGAIDQIYIGRGYGVSEGVSLLTYRVGELTSGLNSLGADASPEQIQNTLARLQHHLAALHELMTYAQRDGVRLVIERETVSLEETESTTQVDAEPDSEITLAEMADGISETLERYSLPPISEEDLKRRGRLGDTIRDLAQERFTISEERVLELNEWSGGLEDGERFMRTAQAALLDASTNAATSVLRGETRGVRPPSENKALKRAGSIK